MNRHSAEDNDETISRSHHELVEEIAQLKERERVLVSENDQLRSQLVEMKEEAHKKYDDLMVQYNMKREYEDDGTSNNQVKVKTESEDDEVKDVIKVEIKEEEENHDIFIKREYVTEYIKTESDAVKVEIKEEIKEEDEEDNDKDREWDRRLVKKELNTAGMIEIKEEVEDGEETRIIDMETLTEDRQVKREIEEENEMTLNNDQIEDWVKREFKEEEEDGETQVDDIEGWSQDDLVGGDEYRSANEPNEVTTVTQADDLFSPSTSTGNGSNQTALNQSTATVPRSPSPPTAPNESLFNSIQHQDNVDSNTDNFIITPPANSTDRITHQTTEHNSTRSQLLTVNLIEGGQNVDEQSSSPLAVTSHSQPSSNHHHHDIRTQTETMPFDSSSNMSNFSDHHHRPDNSQQSNSVSLGSLTDQNVTEMQQQPIKQELPNEATTNDRNEQSNDGDGDFVKDEYFSECEDDSDYVVPEMKDEVHYGQEVEIKQEEEGDTTDNAEMVDIKKEEEEEEDGETQVSDIEGLVQHNQDGDDDNEFRSVDNTPMDTTAARQIGQSNNVQNASNENESIEEGGASFSSEQLPNIANLSYEQTVTQSGGDLLSPSTSTGRRSNRTALNQQATASTGRNATKRKQPTSNRSAKRSKKIIEDDDDGEDGEDIANEDPEELKVKVVYLNCTESNCNVKMTSLVRLHDHLRTVHRLSPFQCYADNCKSRFDNRQQISAHNKLLHPRCTRFLCAVCSTEYVSQNKAFAHWYQSHQNGQFKCNFVSDCTEVTDTRRKMTIHQQVKHYSQSKHCTHPGCTASFSCNFHLKQHERTHLDSNQFHCNWPHCSKQYKLRSNLVRHIRMQHFGLPKSMKAQKEKNIVDPRDPNEYVRVVVDE